MNERALQIYETLQCWLASHSEPPTRSELAAAVGGRAPSDVQAPLVRLRAAGLVTWVPWIARTLRVLR